MYIQYCAYRYMTMERNTKWILNEYIMYKTHTNIPITLSPITPEPSFRGNSRFVNKRGIEDMHMVSIWVRYGFRWHSDKLYRMSHRRVRYGFSECHLIPYRTRMDIICILSHKITLNLSFTSKKRIIEISQPPLKTTECDMASDQNCA